MVTFFMAASLRVPLPAPSAPSGLTLFCCVEVPLGPCLRLTLESGTEDGGDELVMVAPFLLPLSLALAVSLSVGVGAGLLEAAVERCVWACPLGGTVLPRGLMLVWLVDLEGFY